jgi:hypothetical protein
MRSYTIKLLRASNSQPHKKWKYRDKRCKFEDTGLQITLYIVFLMGIQTRLLQRRYVWRGRSYYRRKVCLVYIFVQTIAWANPTGNTTKKSQNNATFPSYDLENGLCFLQKACALFMGEHEFMGGGEKITRYTYRGTSLIKYNWNQICQISALAIGQYLNNKRQ